MSMQTAGDIPLSITSENSSGERRISPSWTIGQLKAKLEAITGIPPLSQKLTLRVPGQQGVPIEAADEENTQLVAFPLVAYAEVHVRIRIPCFCSSYEIEQDFPFISLSHEERSSRVTLHCA